MDDFAVVNPSELVAEAITPEEAQWLLAELDSSAELEACRTDPFRLMSHMKAPDERSGEIFEFNMFDPQGRWSWQRPYAEFLINNKRSITLKARQLGATWIVCGLAVHDLLFKPGCLQLCYRQTELEVVDLVGRIWDLLQSLPRYLWNGGRITTPERADRPHTTIEMMFPGTSKPSTIQGMTSAAASGHGRTARRIILDEFSRIMNADQIITAVSAVAGQTGYINILSTANGVSNPETGAGNRFHYVWVNAPEMGLATEFLPWHYHPDRDQEWFDNSPETRMLKPHELSEQYPSTPAEAFVLGQAVYFDRDALVYYGSCLPTPIKRGYFEPKEPGRAAWHKLGAVSAFNDPDYHIDIYKMPDEGGRYAIGADTGTGRGLDYSSALVMDLETMEFCAEFRGKLDADLYAYQLHYLGAMYNWAWLGPEMAGGYGEPVLIDLLRPKDGRRSYPNLYRGIQRRRADAHIERTFGFNLTPTNRPLVLEELEANLRQKNLPYVTRGLLGEMQTFIRYNPIKPEAAGPWPRAQEGSHDDRVFSAAIVTYMYGQRGLNPQRKTIKHINANTRTSRPVAEVT